MPSLGEDLKKAREERGVTLRNISDTTHIGMRFLQAIENDTYDELPGGIFNRSFVRKYAKHVGLDEDQVLARYDQQLADKGGEPQQKTSVSYLDGFEERSSSGRFWLPALIFMILCAGAYAAYQYSVTNSNDVASEATPAPAKPSPAATQAAADAASPTPTATPEVNQLRLRLAANGDCWTRIKVDDQSPLEKTLRSGETVDYVASEKLTIDLGNVVAVSAEINGRLLKLEPTKGVQVKNVVINKENYQQFLQ